MDFLSKGKRGSGGGLVEMLRKVSLEEAIGHVLPHDITEIRPGEFKGPAFKKGHIIKEEDIPHLRRLGKESIYVLELGPDEVHEDEAAIRLSEVFAGQNIIYDQNPSEGKVSFRAKLRGLFKVDVETLVEVNLLPEMCLSTLHDNTVVKEGQIVASTRVIPLVINRGILERAIQVVKAKQGVFSVLPFRSPFVGIIITGNEVFYGLIEDKFAQVVTKKLKDYDCKIGPVVYCPDDRVKIKEAILSLLDKKVELLLLCGGMSVDPDDVTRLAISDAGARDIVYGTPILPGAMFLYARIGDVPLMGLPACVIYYKATVFDMMLPRVLAGERITRYDLARLAHGGLCLNCKECRYPVCPFGKG